MVNVVKIKMRVKGMSKAGNYVILEQVDDAEEAKYAGVAKYGKVYMKRATLTKAGYDVTTTAKAKKSLGVVNVKLSIVKPDQS